jgi:hypothetical protein
MGIANLGFEGRSYCLTTISTLSAGYGSPIGRRERLFNDAEPTFESGARSGEIDRGCVKTRLFR